MERIRKKRKDEGFEIYKKGRIVFRPFISSIVDILQMNYLLYV